MTGRRGRRPARPVGAAQRRSGCRLHIIMTIAWRYDHIPKAAWISAAWPGAKPALPGRFLVVIVNVPSGLLDA